MSYLLFIDESGQDLRESPHEVLAGICIEDRDLWNFIQQVHDAEGYFFGRRYSPGTLELKGKKLLKRKTFRLASQLPPIPQERRSELAYSCIQKGQVADGDSLRGGVTREELTALAQAKLAFVERVLELCASYNVHAFASIVAREAPRPSKDFLRKDYAFLFERFYYFLEDRAADGRGLVVFDELERSQGHILIDQMSRYFRETVKGRTRASLIIPEPFFVHSHLTTGIQVADIFAYIIAWGVEFGQMSDPARPELASLADLVMQRRYRTERDILGVEDFVVWSFVFIDDLRPREER